MAVPRVYSWGILQNDDPRVSTFQHIDGITHLTPTNRTETQAAALIDSTVVDHPDGARCVFIQNLSLDFDLFPKTGLALPDWFENVQADANSITSGLASYIDGVFSQVTEPFDYFILDEEDTNSSFRISTDSSDGTWTVTGASWSSGTATITTSSAHGVAVGQTFAVNAIVSSGGSYDGRFTATAVTSTTINYALAVDGGTYTSGGTVYGGVDGNERVAQDIFDSANALAMMPPQVKPSNLEASDFRSFPTTFDPTDPLARFNYLVNVKRQRMFRKFLLDRIETQVGYRPMCSNYDDMHMKWHVYANNGHLLPSGGVTNMSSPVLYLDPVGDRFTGTDAQKQYKSFLFAMDHLMTSLASGVGPVVPWVSWHTGSPPAGLVDKVCQHAWEFGCPGFNVFNPAPATTEANNERMLETMFETLPAMNRSASALFQVSQGLTETTFTSGTVTTTLEDVEAML